MGQAKQRGSREDRINQSMLAAAKPKVNPLAGLVQYFGYNREPRESESPLAISKDGLVCMVGNIIEANKSALCEKSQIDFEIGHWFVSTHSCNNIVINGPFEAKEHALDFAKMTANAVRFVAIPSLD